MNRTKRTLATLVLGSAFGIGGAALAQGQTGQGSGTQKQQGTGSAGQGSGSMGQGTDPTGTGTGSGTMEQGTGAEQRGTKSGQGTTGQGQTGSQTARPKPVMGAAEITMTTGTVQSIDKEKRLVVMKDEAGDQIKVQVPPELPAFDQLKKGSKVNLTYHESIAVALLPPGAEQPKTEARVQVTPEQQGGMVGQQVMIAAQIVNVDNKTKSVDLKLPNGQIQHVTVSDPELQRQLKDLKPGQLAQVTYTEAVAASIEPAMATPRSR